jgi:PncC family amidohydrolase
MEDSQLAARVGRLLLNRGWMFCAAESCTGGLLLDRMTDIPGSSAYVTGGVVAYSYEAKERLLRVRHDTLEHFGAVSEETATEMVQGVQEVFDADIAISITGIAGPGGGMPHKPVGLTYIGLYVPRLDLLRVDRHVWSGDRVAIKQASVREALRKMFALLDE